MVNITNHVKENLNQHEETNIRNAFFEITEANRELEEAKKRVINAEEVFSGLVFEKVCEGKLPKNIISVNKRRLSRFLDKR